MELLRDLIVILAASVPVVYLCHKLKIPSIVGFLFTGILVGPHAFGWIKADVEVISEIGIVLLLFTIGLEFSIGKLLQVKKAVFLGGSLQVFLIVGLTILIGKIFFLDLIPALVLGFVISLSSTAIVLKIFQETGLIDSPIGRNSLAVLIYQDIIVVPMLLIIPVLAGKGMTTGSDSFSLILFVLKNITIVLAVILSAHYMVPRLFTKIARTKNRELFLLVIITLCFGIAWTTHAVGLSLSLGAFLAGLIISETDYSHAATSLILPFKDIFTSIFFISIGMLVNPLFMLNNALIISLLTIMVFFLKSLVSAVAVRLSGVALLPALLIGLSLGQIGEFSFILLKSGRENNIIPLDIYQIFLSIILLTMLFSPFILSQTHRIHFLLTKFSFLHKGSPLNDPEENPQLNKLENHIIVVGYGVNGRNVVSAAKTVNLKYVILEGNADTVRKEKALGEPILYGDAIYDEILHLARIDQSKVLVITIPDPLATLRIIATARQMNDKVYIIARARFLLQVEPMFQEGANDVIPEEFETSIEIFSRVLKKYLIPINDIQSIAQSMRSHHYAKLLNNNNQPTSVLRDMIFGVPNLELLTIKIESGSPAAGKSLLEINLRKIYGVTVVAIFREAKALYNPDATALLEAEDILLLLGDNDKLAESACLFSSTHSELTIQN